MSISKKIDRCRLCKSPELKLVIDMGVQASQGQFQLPDEPEPPCVPTAVARCLKCGLVQLMHSTDPATLFRNYHYRSHISQTMRDHLKHIAIEASEMLSQRVAPRILDIGGNSGYLLDCIPLATGVRTIIDPSDVPVEFPGINKITGYFPRDLMLVQNHDLIFTIACFYDAEDPVEFAKSVKKVLASEGLWVVEFADVNSVISKTAYDYFVGEHLTLMSAFTLDQIALKAGLRVVRVEPSASNGGSTRFYLTHDDCTVYDQDHWAADVAAMYSRDRRLAKSDKPYDDFRDRVEKSKGDLLAWLESVEGEVHLLGASTKANVILQYCGITNQKIVAASDRDTRKVGRVTPGTRIPIISEQDSRDRKPSAYLVGPWHFRDELIARERESGNQAKLAFSLPSFEVV